LATRIPTINNNTANNIGDFLLIEDIEKPLE
jgi:hypothetical protein